MRDIEGIVHDTAIIVFANVSTKTLHIKPFGKRHPDLNCVMRNRRLQLRFRVERCVIPDREDN